ncbi:hypothetical protein HDU85_002758 [Gaertneriomyces sp. JEL0708]|nr:hypothetical protein HDU85_002758 [Gaertneriomyces sp. JEL0708]
MLFTEHMDICRRSMLHRLVVSRCQRMMMSSTTFAKVPEPIPGPPKGPQPPAPEDDEWLPKPPVSSYQPVRPDASDELPTPPPPDRNPRNTPPNQYDWAPGQPDRPETPPVEVIPPAGRSPLEEMPTPDEDEWEGKQPVTISESPAETHGEAWVSWPQVGTMRNASFTRSSAWAGRL